MKRGDRVVMTEKALEQYLHTPFSRLGPTTSGVVVSASSTLAEQGCILVLRDGRICPAKYHKSFWRKRAAIGQRFIIYTQDSSEPHECELKDDHYVWVLNSSWRVKKNSTRIRKIKEIKATHRKEDQ